MSKMKLSKNLMQMKFMQRMDQTETEENEESVLFNQNYNYLTKKQKYIFEPSYMFFEQLRFGRQSYKGMNLEIEKLLQDESIQAKKVISKEPALDDVEISDQEMAKRYVQLTNRKAGTSKSNKRKRDD